MEAMTEEVDWIARAGARALVGEVSVLRERMDTVERLLEAKGTISRADIDAWQPDRAEGEERGIATRAYIARVMRGFQQEVEALEAADPPITDWVEKLSRD
jgi:hypothetical protein